MLVQHGRGVRRLWRPGHLLIEFNESPVLGCACSLCTSCTNFSSSLRAAGQPATRDLQDLVEKGALTKTGELRHTRYHLSLAAGDVLDGK
jgi:hypothetical protein